MTRKTRTSEPDINAETDHLPEAGKMIEQEPQTTEQELEPVKATTTKQTAEPTIYTGPALPGGQLARYTVFREGKLMPHIQALVDECPALNKMIVPVSRLAETERKLSDSSSMEAGRFAEINKHFRNKGVKQ
jgi:hypothetical protein